MCRDQAVASLVRTAFVPEMVRWSERVFQPSVQDFVNACRMCGFKAWLLEYWFYLCLYLSISKYLSKCLSIYIISVLYLYVSIAIYINLYQSISIYIYLYIHNMSPYGYPHGPYSFPWPIGRADLIHGSSSTSWMHLTYRAEQTSRDQQGLS